MELWRADECAAGAAHDELEEVRGQSTRSGRESSAWACVSTSPGRGVDRDGRMLAGCWCGAADATKVEGARTAGPRSEIKLWRLFSRV